MAKKKSATNPFYVLLVIVGTSFVVSSCAYGVMAYRDVMSVGPASGDVGNEKGLVSFMDKHGAMVLGVQVLLLGVFTVGAIGTDEFWQRRAASTNRSRSTADNFSEPEEKVHESDAHH